MREKAKYLLVKNASTKIVDYLLSSLIDSAWEQTRIVAREEWWACDEWTMRSTSVNWGFELTLLFVVDTGNPLSVRLAERFGKSPDYIIATESPVIENPVSMEPSLPLIHLVLPAYEQVNNFMREANALRQRRA